MSQVRVIHLGGIDLHRESVCTVVRSNKVQLFKELNNWLFDYLYVNGRPIVQLPPLDDWSRSTEDGSYYYLAFPDLEWNIWIRSEPIEF